MEKLVSIMSRNCPTSITFAADKNAVCQEPRTVTLAEARDLAERNKLTLLGACWPLEDGTYEHYVAYDHLGCIYLLDMFGLRNTWDDAAEARGYNSRYQMPRELRDTVEQKTPLLYHKNPTWVSQDEGPFIFDDCETEFDEKFGIHMFA